MSGEEAGADLRTCLIFNWIFDMRSNSHIRTVESINNGKLLANRGDLKKVTGSKIHNTWRAIRFTKKGREIGCSKEWESFNNFIADMLPSHKDGLRLSRLDKTKPYSKDNVIWVNPSELSGSKRAMLEYKGECKTLIEWALQFNINYNGLRQRYYKGKNYTAKEIIFGVERLDRKIIQDSKKLDYQNKRDKASKMISSYRCKDKKKGYQTSKFKIDWFINHVFNGECNYCETKDNLGLDRLNNKIGHIYDNIVVCCYRCNVVRQDIFTHEQMKKLGKFIKEEIDNNLNKEEK